MTDKPLISVYLPTHNRADLFARALHSVLTQDYTNIEVLVVDDGSRAEHASKIEAICSQDPRVHLFCQPESRGAPRARNIAIAAAKGVYITGLDDDDEFLPGRLQAFVDAVQKFRDVDFFCTGYRYALVGGRELTGLKGFKRVGLAEVLMKNIIGNQIFTRTEVLKTLGGFAPDLPACQDYDLWIRLTAAGYTGVRLPLQNYLIHLDHETPRISTKKRRLEGQQQIAVKHRSLMNPTQVKAQLFYAQLYAGPVSIRTIIFDCPLSLWPLAAKMTLLRWFGRQV